MISGKSFTFIMNRIQQQNLSLKFKVKVNFAPSSSHVFPPRCRIHLWLPRANFSFHPVLFLSFSSTFAPPPFFLTSRVCLHFLERKNKSRGSTEETNGDATLFFFQWRELSFVIRRIETKKKKKSKNAKGTKDQRSKNRWQRARNGVVEGRGAFENAFSAVLRPAFSPPQLRYN